MHQPAVGACLVKKRFVCIAIHFLVMSFYPFWIVYLMLQKQLGAIKKGAARINAISEFHWVDQGLLSNCSQVDTLFPIL